MLWGLDLLGVAKYRDIALREFPKGWALGAFANTFGDVFPTIEAFCKTGKPKRVRIHGLWKDDHNFTEADIPAAQKEGRRLAAFAENYPEIEFRYSPCCEHRMDAELAEKYRQETTSVIGRCLYVNTPMTGGATLGKCLNEIHGGRFNERIPPGPIDFSYDGTAAEDSDVEGFKRKFAQADTFYFWSPRFNGSWEMGVKLPRPERNGWPDRRMMRSIAYLHNVRGETKLPSSKWLWKSHSENKGTGDPRAEKPCLIGPVNVPVVTLRVGSKVIGTFKKYGGYDSGRWRYYGTIYGYEYVKKANQSVVDIYAGRKKYGHINPGFRDGVYR